MNHYNLFDTVKLKETIGVETLYPHQLELIQKASETISVRGHSDNFPKSQ